MTNPRGPKYPNLVDRFWGHRFPDSRETRFCSGDVISRSTMWLMGRSLGAVRL